MTRLSIGARFCEGSPCHRLLFRSFCHFQLLAALRLRSVFVALAGRRAMQIARANKRGLQAWRAWLDDTSQSQPKFLSMRQNILKFDFAADGEQRDAVLDTVVFFDRPVTDYQAMARERLGSQLKCAVVPNRATAALRKHLLLACTSLLRCEAERGAERRLRCRS